MIGAVRARQASSGQCLRSDW